MNENIHTKGEADFRQYEQVWQRVAPALNPWPATVPGTSAAQNDAQTMQSDAQNMQNDAQNTGKNVPIMPDAQNMRTVPQIAQDSRNIPQNAQNSTQISQNSMQNAQQISQNGVQNAQQMAEASLPGAERNPCCMGTEALTDTDVLTGFVEEELFLQREFQALSQETPLWVRPSLRTFAGNSSARARRLMAVYYLITGKIYEPALPSENTFHAGGNFTGGNFFGGTSAGNGCAGGMSGDGGFTGGMSGDSGFTGGMSAGNCFDLLFGGNRFGGGVSAGWCAGLRQRYHDTACTALNYIRAAEETTDPCLARVLDELSEQAYQQSSEILRILERAIP